MHIIIGGLIALGTIFWAITRIMDGAGDIKMASRRYAWQKKYDEKLVDILTDPRQSAAILMVQIAKYDGDLTAHQNQAILQEIKTQFQATHDQAEEFLAFARMALGQVVDVTNIMGKVLRPLKENYSPELKQELLKMLTVIGETENQKLILQQESLINQVNRSLG